MKRAADTSICERIATLRLEAFGPRGKSNFAKHLGLSPSTYDYYESRRVPPAEVLVKIADLTGVDLRWLLTGEVSDGPPVPASHPIVQRVAALLAAKPDAAEPLAAFVELLSESLKFPGNQEQAASSAVSETTPPETPEPAGPEERAWIAIMGRTAAGVPQFWKDASDEEGTRTLAELVDRAAQNPSRRVRLAEAHEAHGSGLRTAQIITLNAPQPGQPAEFVSAGQIKARYPDAFAVRIDGESMVPDIRHGDVVVLSPSAAAVDGQAAVVQLRHQIGVTCKLYRREGRTVHLVPINEQFPPQSFPAEQVIWALRVLAQIRP